MWGPCLWLSPVNLSPFSTGNPLRHTWNHGKAGISRLLVTLHYVTVQTTWLAPGEGIHTCPGRWLLRCGRHRLLSQPAQRPQGALGGVTGEQTLQGKWGQRTAAATVTNCGGFSLLQGWGLMEPYCGPQISAKCADPSRTSRGTQPHRPPAGPRSHRESWVTPP